MNNTPENQVASSPLSVTAGFGEVLARMKSVNARLRALKALLPIKHTGDVDAYEAAIAHRLTEECAIMAESLGAMQQMDECLSLPKAERLSL